MQKNFWLKLNIDRMKWLLPPLVLWLGVWVTNQYIPIANNEQFFISSNGDSLSYLQVAKSCQGRAAEYRIPFHHAQRFLIPCLIGKLDGITHFGIEMTARVFVFLASLVSLMGVFAVLRRLRIGTEVSILALTYLAFNPYLYRLYNTMPMQLIDVSFVCAMVFTIFGLVSKKPKIFWMSLALSAFTRQTAVMLWFPIALYFNWMKPEPRPFIKTAAAAIVLWAGYIAGAFFARDLSGPNQNVEHLLGIVDWLSTAFDAKRGLEFLVRAFIPFAGVLILFALPRRLLVESSDQKWVILLFSFNVFLSLQPLLGGPVVVGQAVARLMAYGVIPAVIAAALWIDRSQALSSQSELTRAYLWIAPILISFHHIYSYNGGLTSDLALRFSMNTAAVTFLGLVIIKWEARS